MLKDFLESSGTGPLLREIARPQLADRKLADARMASFLEREAFNNGAALQADVLILIIAVYFAMFDVLMMGVVRLAADVLLRLQLRKIQAAGLNSPEFPRWHVRFQQLYFLAGLSWGMVAWPAYYNDNLSLLHVLLASMSLVSIIVFSATTCLAPRIFFAATSGQMIAYLAMLYFAGSNWPFLLAAILILNVVTMGLAGGGYKQISDMFVMQFQRDAANTTQQQIISELKAARLEASRLASTDNVTQIPNRASFIEHIESLIAGKAQQFSIVFVDLDHFKNINDTLGHAAGDLALVAVAREMVRIEACYAARMGGDEFALVLKGDWQALQISDLITSLAARINPILVGNEKTIDASFTCGSAQFPDDGSDLFALLNAADLALRKAKQTQRGTYQNYRQELNQAFMRESRIAELLEKSIGERNFEIHFQPQVRLADNRVVAAEALTRFSCKELGAFPVKEVFDTAEVRGLANRLAAVVLEVAADTIAGMRPHLPAGFPIAFNLSQSNLKAPEELYMSLKGIVARGVNPEAFKLEITENAISGRGLDDVRDILARISELGFPLSLDDFGTGYSSMTLLKKLPVTELKIDKLFVDSILGDRKDQAIVRSAVAMCDHLDINCVVEGVETVEQAMQLRILGVKHGQGYLWSKALPRQPFVEFVRLFGEAREVPPAAQHGAA